jgi:REP element-mobilizing transposase RayT
MSRPPRLDHAGALWHITSRGNDRADIYRDDDDRYRWLRALTRAVDLNAWNLHAYVMMDNHFHLLLGTPERTLSRGMQQLNGGYTQAYNRRHRHIGHLFQGRFGSEPIETEAHLLEVSRYVVLNPVRAGLVNDAADWPWSSYRATAGLSAAPHWLQTEWTLGHFGGSRMRYQEFVAAGRDVPHVVGRRAFEAHGAAIASAARPPVERSGVDELLPRLLAALEISPVELLAERRTRTRHRALVAYALRRLTGATCRRIGAELGVGPWHAAYLARSGESLWNSGIEHAVRTRLTPPSRV